MQQERPQEHENQQEHTKQAKQIETKRGKSKATTNPQENKEEKRGNKEAEKKNKTEESITILDVILSIKDQNKRILRRRQRRKYNNWRFDDWVTGKKKYTPLKKIDKIK